MKKIIKFIDKNFKIFIGLIFLSFAFWMIFATEPHNEDLFVLKIFAFIGAMAIYFKIYKEE